MAKAINKPKKQRPNKYDEKLAIKGTFADVFKVVKKNKEEKKKASNINQETVEIGALLIKQ